jgi:predicted phosphoribosyltransferase
LLTQKKESFQEVDAMRFENREEAATLLGDRLARYRGQRPLVLGVPRGGVPMARIVADALGGDLDIVLVRKLRAAGQPELAIGAVDEGGTVFKGRYFDIASDAYLRAEVRTQREILRRRREHYMGSQPSIDPKGRIVIIVDDGIATGASMLSAIRSIRARRPQRVVVAIGVAPPASLASLGGEANEVVCLWSADEFYAVGQFFDDFSEVTDEMVAGALRRPAKSVISQSV